MRLLKRYVPSAFPQGFAAWLESRRAEVAAIAAVDEVDQVFVEIAGLGMQAFDRRRLRQHR